MGETRKFCLNGNNGNAGRVITAGAIIGMPTNGAAGNYPAGVLLDGITVGVYNEQTGSAQLNYGYQAGAHDPTLEGTERVAEDQTPSQWVVEPFAGPGEYRVTPYSHGEWYQRNRWRLRKAINGTDLKDTAVVDPPIPDQDVSAEDAAKVVDLLGVMRAPVTDVRTLNMPSWTMTVDPGDLIVLVNGGQTGGFSRLSGFIVEKVDAAPAIGFDDATHTLASTAGEMPTPGTISVAVTNGGSGGAGALTGLQVGTIVYAGG